MDSFSALSVPTRRRIVEHLAQGPMASGDIARQFDITAPAISQHLKALQSAKLVRVRREAQRRIYELDEEGIGELERWIGELKAFWTTRFDALAATLREAPASTEKGEKDE
jgi:DNA-binding transcriptional ArsR family regulator